MTVSDKNIVFQPQGVVTLNYKSSDNGGLVLEEIPEWEIKKLYNIRIYCILYHKMKNI